MTQEERELLFKDLCARLPYGVKFLRESWNYEWDQEMSVVKTLEDIDNEGYINHTRVYKVEDINPYLRPLDSMTDEEKDKYYSFMEKDAYGFPSDSINKNKINEYMSWLLSHHFDYRGLIGKGLALEAPKSMYAS